MLRIMLLMLIAVTLNYTYASGACVPSIFDVRKSEWSSEVQDEDVVFIY